nr:MAG TPA: hypothetical protein [Caudoviricetes sp.]DAV32406.1 MAG TPA: hypothetical protein [Caudoviricetes sp.]
MGKRWPQRQADCREYRLLSIDPLRMEKQISRIFGSTKKGQGRRGLHRGE